MADGIFNIPMSEYYSKSSDFKGKVSELITNVESHFLNKVSRNLGQLDPQDANVVEYFASYTEAKRQLEVLREYETKLHRMSSEGENNPLYSVVSIDQQYSSAFSDISKGASSSAVAAVVGSINQGVENEKMSLAVQGYLKVISKFVSDNDIVQSLLLLAKKNPSKALGMIWANEEIVAQLIATPEGTKLLEGTLKTLEFFGKGGELTAKWMGMIANNQTFVRFMDKTPTYLQDKVLNTMIQLSDDGWKLLNKSSKLVEWAGKLAELQPVKWVTKWGSAFAKTSLGKVALSPWVSIAITGVSSGIDAYVDPKSKAHGHIGKAVAGGVIDAVASVGPIEGLLIGTKAGGVKGALIGLGIGAIVQVTQFFSPDFKKGVKNFVYDLIDGPQKFKMAPSKQPLPPSTGLFG